MHGRVTIGELVLMGADIAPEGYEAPKGFSLSVQIKGVADAERIFHELANGGRVVLPLEKTFWAARFGMLLSIASASHGRSTAKNEASLRPCVFAVRHGRLYSSEGNILGNQPI